MIAAWSESCGVGGAKLSAVSRALALFCGQAPATGKRGDRWLASAPPGRTSPPVEPPITAEGRLLAFDGWIDEAPGTPAGAGDARRYAGALGRHGDRAECRVVGHYASAVWEGDGTLRLARSPWRAPPLHYAILPEGPVASSLLRVLFAVGAARELDRARLIDALYFDQARSAPGSWYRGIELVPLGSVVRIRPDGAVETRRWYDPHALSPGGHRKDADCLEEARELIDRAGALAVRRSRRPAIALSGGLDSPLAASVVVRHADPECRPFAVTSIPDPEWDGRERSGTFADEAPFVADFCSRHGLQSHISRDGGFDGDLSEFYRATEMTTMQIGNAGPLHGVWRRARDNQADWLFDAVIGNDTISSDAPWSYAENLRFGRWRQLALSLANRSHDPRSLGRKLAALAVLPLMPRAVQYAVRTRFSAQKIDFARHASLLRPEIIAREHLSERARALGNAGPSDVPSRRELVDFAWAASDSGLADFNLGMEQIYGPRHRDVLAYRPLIEFSLRLPTSAFVKDGMHRRLARQLLRGIASEEQRLNPLNGEHNADWFIHLTRRREAVRDQLVHIEGHPLLGELIDTGRAARLLREWPSETPVDPAGAWPLSQGMVNLFCLTRFVGHVEGRNDL